MFIFGNELQKSGPMHKINSSGTNKPTGSWDNSPWDNATWGH